MLVSVTDPGRLVQRAIGGADCVGFGGTIGAVGPRRVPWCGRAGVGFFVTLPARTSDALPAVVLCPAFEKAGAARALALWDFSSLAATSSADRQGFESPLGRAGPTALRFARRDENSHTGVDPALHAARPHRADGAMAPHQ